jgi:hypothetical protein
VRPICTGRRAAIEDPVEVNDHLPAAGEAHLGFPAPQPVRVPPEGRRWPWHHPGTFASVLVLTVLYAPVLALAGLGVVMGLMPSGPCPADVQCGADAVPVLLFVVACSAVALLLGWAPRVPGRLRAAALLLGLAVAATVLVKTFQ